MLTTAARRSQNWVNEMKKVKKQSGGRPIEIQYRYYDRTTYVEEKAAVGTALLGRLTRHWAGQHHTPLRSEVRLETTAHHEAVHVRLPRLTDAVDATDHLLLYGDFRLRLDNDHVRSRGEC